MNTNSSGVTERAFANTDLDKYAENYDRIFNEDKQVNRTITVIELMKLNEMFTDKIKELEGKVKELEKKLEIAIEALNKLGEIRRLDGNGNEYEGREYFIAKEALAAINAEAK